MLRAWPINCTRTRTYAEEGSAAGAKELTAAETRKLERDRAANAREGPTCVGESRADIDLPGSAVM